MRLLVIDPGFRLLLLHYLTPDTHEDFWCTPGGALAGGESPLDAARRELREEVGLELDSLELGACVWQREHRFRIGDGRLFVQEEEYYALRVPAFEPVFRALSDFERGAVVGYRWWTVTDLAATSKTLQPPNLAELVTSVGRA